MLFLALMSMHGVAGATDASGPVTTYYLALGGSASIGFQPTAARPQGQPTDTGYANDLLSIERSRWHDLQLVQLGSRVRQPTRSWAGEIGVILMWRNWPGRSNSSTLIPPRC